MSIILNGTTGITTPEVAAESYTGPLAVNASAPDDSLVVNASGNVGIGTASISGKISINGEVYAAAGAASGVAYGFYPKGTYGNTGMFSPAPNTVAFATTGGERARIDSSGNLLINCTVKPSTGGAGSYGLATESGISTAGVPTLTWRSNVATSDVFYFYSSTALAGYIRVSGSATSYVTASDYRLKENVQPMIGALAKVVSLKPVTYNWKLDGLTGQGFIAHELAEVAPDCVSGEKDAVNEDGSIKPQGIDTSFLVATLTAAIQEQQVLITQQAAAIDDLTARVSALEAV